MSVSRVEGEAFFSFDRDYFYNQTHRAVEVALPRFARAIRTHVGFHLLFILLITLEIVACIALFSWLSESAFLALALAGLFFTLFSFLILRLYMQAKKPVHFLRIRDDYILSCQELLGCQEGVPEYHMAMANACSRAATALTGQEHQYYHPPRGLSVLRPTLERLSEWCHWEDVHRMRELFLLSAMDEHIKLVKCEPTNLEVHTALASTYVMLSSLYQEPFRSALSDDGVRLKPQDVQRLEQRFRLSAERAIEEFKILNDYAPDDPWIHTQLAYSYRDLRMPAEEIREYETVLRLRPGDNEILLRLGTLYFQQGLNAKGLQAYEQLKRSNFKKAEQLIRYYGSYR